MVDPETPRQPMAKLHHAQDLLEFLEQREVGTRERLLAAAPEDVAQLLRSAGRTQWVTLDQDAKFVDAFVAEFGARRAVDAWAAYTARFVRSPLQRAMFEGAKRLFGLNAPGLARMFPRAWSTAYRDAGLVKAAQDPDGNVRVMLDGLPTQMTGRRGYFLMLEGLGRGLMRLFHEDESRLGLHIDAAHASAVLEFPAAGVHEDLPLRSR